MEKIGVAIIGAGPAGLQAAITLAQLGHYPFVFEEHPIVGKPIQCGEGLSVYAFEDFLIPKEDKELCVKEFQRCKIHFSEHHVIYGDVNAFSINRDVFDQKLARKATELGVTILLSKKVTKIDKVKGGYNIHIDDEEIPCYKSQFLIIAEGYKAKLTQDLCFLKPEPMIKGLEYKIQGIWCEDLEFHFNAEKYPYGYCWIFPRKDETNVGIVTTAKNRREKLERFLQEKGITGVVKQKIGGQIPMNGPLRKINDEHVFLVGDVAGMVNPIFYGGIRLAMTSGKVAAESIKKSLDDLKNGKQIKSNIYSNNLKKYPFMRKVNLKCHNYFYSRSNDFLEKLASILDGKYINRIKGWEKIKVIFSLLKHPLLLKSPRGLYQIYRGFKIARDWGF